MPTGSEVIDDIFRRFAARGDAAYLGEPVSQTEHALQTAMAAEHDGAPADLVASALLHDIGHLLTDAPDDAADHGLDTVHEDLGADWLAQWFPPVITEPLRLHVAAKRYLCAVEPAYRDALSPASLTSLALQGGPMSESEVREFERHPHWQDAVRLRRWDDVGKVEGLPTPDVMHYRAALQHALRPQFRPADG